MTNPESKEPFIEATFRNGSLTAISVLLGFSLSFLSRWAGLPGPWRPIDLAAVSTIVAGIVIQVTAVAMLLSVASLRSRYYNWAVTLFLLGLAFVAVGVALAILSDIFEAPQQVLRG